MPPAPDFAFFEPEFTDSDFFSGLFTTFGFSSFTELTEFDLTGSSEDFLVLAKAPSNAPVFLTYCAYYGMNNIPDQSSRIVS